MSSEAMRQGSEERRQRIVAAAIALFSARPYHDVQVDDVARAACVAKPTLYRYFAAKEDLFIEAMTVRLDGVERCLQEQTRLSVPASEVLRSAIAIVLDAFGRDAPALVLVEGADIRLGERARSVVRRKVRSLRACFAQIIRAGIAEGVFDVSDPDVAADAVLGAIRLTAVTSAPDRRAHAAAVLAQIFTAGLASAQDQAAAAARSTAAA